MIVKEDVRYSWLASRWFLIHVSNTTHHLCTKNTNARKEISKNTLKEIGVSSRHVHIYEKHHLLIPTTHVDIHSHVRVSCCEV